MLEAVNLSKTYISDGISYDALRAVDLKIDKGERAAITGRSGSGKSTLMHLLACLDEPTGGKVLLDGKDISGLSERERNVLRNEKFGFVFQQFFLNGRETVLENVALPLRIRGWRESKIRSAAKAALASVDLEDKAGKRAKDLSGGEKQRVCVARALVGEPQMIFADEPTGNLDSTTGKLLEDMLFQLNAARGITLVIVTHDPDLARRCGRVVNVKDGRIETDLGAKGEVR
ncbi:MAG TPA: ABC transporter ATP-binding protein [Pyrinomonadaceae bacterium]|nr:ABC transporter ATP-binding protein [Pyrinomonadaceae bacterium]